jgi:D-aminopeptidase
MKIYITFDREGCSGIAYRAQVGQDSSRERFATDDAKAAIYGVLDVDLNAEIWFNDAHGRSMNVYFEEFPENVTSVVGSAELMDEVLGLGKSLTFSYV